jgi:hypothetical protein
MSRHERWLPVVGFGDRYQVSNLGRVRSLCSSRGWRRIPRVIIPFAGGGRDNEYLKVTLCRDGKRKCEYVHNLVLTAFVGQRPIGQECRHLNDSPRCNRLDNLVWGTAEENMQDRMRNRRSA